MRTDCRNRTMCRRAIVAMELLFALPVLLALLFGMLQFSMFLTARQQLTTAAREGARVAALGGDQQEVEQAVQLFLGQGVLSQAGIEVVLAGPEGNEIRSGEPVQVTVSVPVGRVAPDMLAFVGFGMGNKTLAARAVMRKE